MGDDQCRDFALTLAEQLVVSPDGTSGVRGVYTVALFVVRRKPT